MIKSLSSLYSYLRLPEEEIKVITDNIHTYYYYKVQPKRKYGEDQIGENGSIRIRKLFPPRHVLKILQQKINGLLQEITLPDYVFGSVKGRNNIMNAAAHANNHYFLTIDLKEFFSCINNKQVFQVFLANGFSPSVARTLTQLTTHKGNLPQGAPTSPTIANLAFVNAGNKLLEYLKPYDITFTTFLDDISFSSKSCFKHHTYQIQNIIKEGEFFINYNKIKYRVNTCDITGLIVSKGNLKVISKMNRKAKTNVHLKAYCKSVYNFSSKL